MQSLFSQYALTGLLLAMMNLSATAQDNNEFGAWSLRCEQPGTNVKACIMFQNLVLKTGGQPVLQFAIGIAPGDANPTVLVSLPLGISLPPGITISIDQGKPATFPVERCEPDGCQAGMKLREQTIEQLRGGKALQITFYDGERQPIPMPLSLNGFGSAFDALTEASQGAAQ